MTARWATTLSTATSAVRAGVPGGWMRAVRRSPPRNDRRAHACLRLPRVGDPFRPRGTGASTRDVPLGLVRYEKLGFEVAAMLIGPQTHVNGSRVEDDCFLAPGSRCSRERWSASAARYTSAPWCTSTAFCPQARSSRSAGSPSGIRAGAPPGTSRPDLGGSGRGWTSPAPCTGWRGGPRPVN